MTNEARTAIFRKFIPFAVVITLLCGLFFVGLRQILRQSANDPQIQIVEDVSNALADGVPPQAIANPNSTNIGKSLATFIIIYDSSKSAVLSSATLDGKTPELPKTVLEEVDKEGQKVFTWEPKEDVRTAAVIQKYQDKPSGYVLVARSIREVEKRELMLEQIVGIAWIVTLTITFISINYIHQGTLGNLRVDKRPRRKPKK